MAVEIANTFIAALRSLEEGKDVEPLAALYADDAVIGNVVAPDQFTGRDGARRFWTEYRGTFGTVQSEFRNVITTDKRAALEWTTTGTGFDGAPINYSGVTILEADGDQITRSTAYFDPKSLGRQIEANV